MASICACNFLSKFQITCHVIESAIFFVYSVVFTYQKRTRSFYSAFWLQCLLITMQPLLLFSYCSVILLRISCCEGYNTGKVDRVCTQSYNEILSFLLNTLSITTFIVIIIIIIIIIIITIVFSLASCSSHWRSRVHRWNLGAMMRVVMVYLMDQLLLKIWTVPRRTNF